MESLVSESALSLFVLQAEFADYRLQWRSGAPDLRPSGHLAFLKARPSSPFGARWTDHFVTCSSIRRHTWLGSGLVCSERCPGTRRQRDQ